VQPNKKVGETQALQEEGERELGIDAGTDAFSLSQGEPENGGGREIVSVLTKNPPRHNRENSRTAAHLYT